MALSETVIGIFGKTSAGTPAFVTGSFTPPANSLLVVRVYLMRNTGESEIGTPTISGGSLVWTARGGANTILKPAWSTRATWFTAPVGGSPASMSITVDDLNNLNIFEYVVSVIAYTGYDTTTPIGGINGSSTTNIGDGEEARTLSEAPRAEDITLLSIDVDATIGPPKPSLETGWTSVHEKSGGESGIAIAKRTGSTSTTVKVKDSYAGGGTFGKGGMGAMVIRAAASGKSVEIGQATETETSQAMAHTKAKALERATETDTAQAFAHTKAKALERVSETDTAQSMTERKAKAVGQAVETDTAQVLGASKRKSIDQVSEVDLAQAMTERKSATIGQVSETDNAGVISAAKRRVIERVTETDIAQAFARAKRKLLGQVSETDTAQALGRLKLRQLAQVVETDTAAVIGSVKRKVMGQVTETDTAGAMTLRKRKAIGQVTEIDTAGAFTSVRLLVVGRVTETDTAGAFELPLPPTPHLEPPLGAICLSAEPTGAVLVVAARSAVSLGAEKTGARLIAAGSRGAVVAVPARSAVSLGAEETSAVVVGERARSTLRV